MNRRIACLAVVLFAIVVVGCGRKETVYVIKQEPRHYGHDHVCTRHCHTHCYEGDRLIVLKGHRHGPGCGHRWTGRRWLVVRKPTVRRSVHVCTRDCHHHYYNGKRLVILKRHKHGPGCGHRWNGEHWVKVRNKTGRRR